MATRYRAKATKRDSSKCLWIVFVIVAGMGPLSNPRAIRAPKIRIRAKQNAKYTTTSSIKLGRGISYRKQRAMRKYFRIMES